MNITFEGKRVLVTGAGQGIGRQLVKEFLRCKAEKVFALSKTGSNLELLKAELAVANLEIVCVDVSDWEATRKAVQQLGRIDCLVNNAAVALLEPFLQVTENTFDRSFNVNLKSIINISQVVTKTMIENGAGGTVVNVSSQASKIALKNHTVYSATKAALDSLTRSMALELGGYNIRVNAINPTVVMTEMGRLGWQDPNKAKTLLDRIPLHRFAEIEDVTNAVLFLSSDASGIINATTLPIDGGILAC